MLFQVRIHVRGGQGVVSAAEMLEYGDFYMTQIVKNSQALGKALEERGVPVLAAERGYSKKTLVAETHDNRF